MDIAIRPVGGEEVLKYEQYESAICQNESKRTYHGLLNINTAVRRGL